MHHAFSVCANVAWHCLGDIMRTGTPLKQASPKNKVSPKIHFEIYI